MSFADVPDNMLRPTHSPRLLHSSVFDWGMPGVLDNTELDNVLRNAIEFDIIKDLQIAVTDPSAQEDENNLLIVPMSAIRTDYVQRIQLLKREVVAVLGIDLSKQTIIHL